jgi:hypothetical protein
MAIELADDEAASNFARHHVGPESTFGERAMSSFRAFCSRILFAAVIAVASPLQACGGEAGSELAEAIADTEARAEKGDPHAEFLLGVYLRNAPGAFGSGEVDYERVVSLYERSAEQGYAPADYALGKLYDRGIGVPEDVETAIEHYRNAAEAGIVPAMGSLAAAYAATGRISGAVNWSSRAAEAGNASGMNTLGALHQKGYGVQKNYSRSMELFRQAAEAGDCHAMMNIGGLYYNGDGVVQDPTEAERWFRKAKACRSEDTEATVAIADKYIGRIREGMLPGPEAMDELAPRAASSQEVAAALVILYIVALASAPGDPLPSSGTPCNTTFGMDAGTCNPGVDIGVAGVMAGLW